MEVTILTIVLGTIGAAFTFVTLRNGRLSQQLIRGTQEMIKESRESTERLIKEIHHSLQQSLRAIQQSIEAADKRRAEDTIRITDILNKMDTRRAEDTKYLAELITKVSRP